MKQTIVIVGAGRGMGNHIGYTFARNGFRVVLLARNKQNLDAYVQEFRENQFECYGIPADASDPDSLTRAFTQIKQQFDTIDVLIYNAAILTAGKPSTLTSEDLMKHYQVDVASALHCVNLVLPEQKKAHRGTILFTGGGLALKPMAQYACISIDKAALRTLAYTLNEELKDAGIYVGIVTITGNVAEGTRFDPALIAETYWQLYQKREVAEVIYD